MITVKAPVGATVAHIWHNLESTTTGSTVVFSKLGYWVGAAGRFSAPGVPVVGQSHIAVNDATNLSGTGAPEYSVAASPGSTYLQVDATNDVKGWIKWIKATGTSTTGWIAGPEADTGWRDVTAGLTNSWTMQAGGKLILRRAGGVVTLQAGYRLDGSAASSDNLYTMPSGFAPVVKTGMRMIGVGTSSTSGSGWPTVPLRPVNFAHPVISMQSGNVVNEFTLRFDTADTWPSSLPGSAA